MVIYYTHSYTNTEGESHRLLEKAIAAYLNKYADSADSEKEAKRLITNIGTCGEFGKPCIGSFAPFSISHSAGTWAVLISEQGTDCGLDIQYERKADASAVARRFYAPSDAEIIEGLSRSAVDAGDDHGSDALHEFFRLWARREALVKAIGTSVAESDLPEVSSGRAEYKGKRYIIEDIKIPAEAFLHAAVCCEDLGCEICPPELLIL